MAMKFDKDGITFPDNTRQTSAGGGFDGNYNSLSNKPTPASTTTNKIPQWSNTTGTLKDGLGLSTSSTLSGNSDSNVPSEKAVKAYVDVNTDLSEYGIAPYAKHLDDNDDLNSDAQYGLQIYKWNTALPSNAPSPSFNYGVGVRFGRNNVSWGQLIFKTHSSDPKLFLKTATAVGQADWAEVLHTKNTDLIVSSGVNANGYWVQFADGTQICYLANSFASNGSNIPLETFWAFPKSFKDAIYTTSCTLITNILVGTYSGVSMCKGFTIVG